MPSKKLPLTQEIKNLCQKVEQMGRAIDAIEATKQQPQNINDINNIDRDEKTAVLMEKIKKLENQCNHYESALKGAKKKAEALEQKFIQHFGQW